ncbi:HAD hydrolase family protein [Patescibacteria group bacterium]|nr:HAD hydrolase family protein [Patescibacteria group bacterium]
MTKRLVLIDIDNTLVNIDLGFDGCSADQIKIALRKAMSSGLTIGLHSDRPAFDLFAIHKNLGLNGPIIAEKGNILHFPPKWDMEPNQDHRFLMFQFLKTELLNILLTEFSDIDVFVGKNQKMFRFLAQNRPAENRKIVLINNYRKLSLAFNVCEQDPESENLCMNLVEQTAKIIRNLFTAIFEQEPTIEIYPATRACIIHLRDSHKRNSLPKLFRQYGAGHKIIMIGDSAFDFLGKDITHCAVENASAEYKALCNFIAQKDRTCGVIECLKWIQRGGHHGKR